jgi:hypothetical protein
MFKPKLIINNLPMMWQGSLTTAFQSKTCNICSATRYPSKSFLEFFWPRVMSTKSILN